MEIDNFRITVVLQSEMTFWVVVISLAYRVITQKCTQHEEGLFSL